MRVKARGKVQRGRTDRGVPNKTEQRFADQYLEPLRRAGEVIAWRYESLAFTRLPGGHRYTPDYVATMADGTVRCIEVKGSAGWNAPHQESSKIRFKLACSEYPEFEFWTAIEGRKGEARWKLEEYNP